MKFIELFAGIGGFRFGLEKANQESRSIVGLSGRPDIRPKRDSTNNASTGWQQGKRQYSYRCIWANEIDKYACQIYRKNFGNKELVEGDIKTIPAKSIPDHDLLTAGFPCPSYSIAGKRKGFEDPRGALFFEICRIAKTKKPALLLLENVDGLLNHENGETFRIILYSLSELGYDCEWEVLNSTYYSVPQHRKRVFIIGHLRGTGGQKVFPLGKNDTIFNRKDDAKKRHTQTKISTTLRGPEMKADHTYIKELIQVGNVDRKGHNSLWGRIYNPEGVSSAINAKGGGLGAKTGLYAVSPTLYGFKHGTHKHFNEILPKQLGLIRRLTPTECERLQGFPDGWTEGISDTQRYKCLGNAVTTNVITEIGKRMDRDPN